MANNDAAAAHVASARTPNYSPPPVFFSAPRAVCSGPRVYVNRSTLNTPARLQVKWRAGSKLSAMNRAQIYFFITLGLAAVAFVGAAISSARARRDLRAPRPAEIALGFASDFFDTLGIGSFAPTTAVFKLRRMVPDELIPGTLNVGHSFPVIVEALVFVGAITVDPVLLVAMIASATVGGWLGAGMIARLSRRAIQIVMGSALLTAGCIFTLVNLGLLPGGGLAMQLGGWKFALAVSVNFALGALMSAGIGLYAPCMIMLALLGMHPLASFPIMMGACALLQPVASLRFFRSGAFAWGPSLGLTIGGIPGVLVAAFVVKSLPLTALRWLVIVVVAYAAFAMMRSARRHTRTDSVQWETSI
jgi:uncharacterized membrane protein YfcA